MIVGRALPVAIRSERRWASVLGMIFQEFPAEIIEENSPDGEDSSEAKLKFASEFYSKSVGLPLCEWVSVIGDDRHNFAPHWRVEKTARELVIVSSLRVLLRSDVGVVYPRYPHRKPMDRSTSLRLSSMEAIPRYRSPGRITSYGQLRSDDNVRMSSEEERRMKEAAFSTAKLEDCT